MKSMITRRSLVLTSLLIATEAPLARAEPDLSRPIEERDPGGLGILLMRRMTDRIEYRRVIRLARGVERNPEHGGLLLRGRNGRIG